MILFLSILMQLQFQRCARTDKGVSAARQVVSIKISIFASLIFIAANGYEIFKQRKFLDLCVINEMIFVLSLLPAHGT